MAGAKMQLEDWLDDLCVRFIINLPQEELSSVERICFQVEEAQWFYEDFIRPLDPTLPSMSLRTFCLRIFQHCPLLAPFSVENHTKAFESFLQYKSRVPVRGAILLNDAMDSTVLVKGWKKGANWSFPRGKINKDEDDLDCAIREVYEETGFDIRAAGLVPRGDEVKYIEITMREQQMRLYVFRNIPMDTHFEPRTRKEISKIEWYRLSDLPAFRKKGAQANNDAAAANANKFYMVAPFLVPLKKWVVQQKRKDIQRAASETYLNLPLGHLTQEDVVTEDDLWTQNEPATDQVARTPGLDTLEGATLELQRLLKVQPPTQGLQMQQLSPTTGGNKAGALLALLQAKGISAQNPQLATSPHSYQDISHAPLINTDIPPPQSPHGPRNPTQRANISSYQYPPLFPIMTSASTDRNQDWMQPHQGIPTAPQTQLPQYHYSRNDLEHPALAGPGNARVLPALLHPQPLPPQAKSILSSGALQDTPPPPNATTANMPQPTNLSTILSQTMEQHHPQSSASVQKPPLPALGSNSAALLSMFKGQTALQGDPKLAAMPTSQPLPAREQNQYSAAANLQSQVASHHAYYSQTTYQTQGSAPAVPSAVGRVASDSPITLATVSVRSTANVQAGPKAAAPTDPHRSGLLDLFKKNDSAASRESAGSGEFFQSTSDGSSITAKAMQSHNPQLSTASHLPVASSLDAQFRMTGLSLQPQAQVRPAPGMSEKLLPHALQQAGNFSTRDVFLPTAGSTFETGKGMPAQSEHMLHGLENRAAAAAERSHLHSMSPPVVTLPYARIGHLPQAGFAGAPSTAGFPLPEVMSRRQEPTVQQQQTLLSLFRPSQDGGMGVSVGVGNDQKRELSIPEAAPRSRIASLASIPGDSDRSSRRESETPISPANREFILGYLENVTKTAARH